MTFDLLAMAILSISAFIVVMTMANILGSNRRQRIVVGVMLGIWFVGVCAVGASRSIVGGGSHRLRSTLAGSSSSSRAAVGQRPVIPLR